jgi:hypothetical protein
MSTTRAKLIQQAALRMDEISPESVIIESVGPADNNPLYELIDGLVEDAMLELFSVAPYWRLSQTFFPATDIVLETIFSGTKYERKMIRIRLGEDFLRAAEILHPSFLRPITEVFAENSSEGRRQHNRYLFGKTAKPVAVMSHGLWNGEPCREIDCYSVSKDVTDASEVTASYIAKPTITINSNIELAVPPVLVPALEWLLAARAFGARGDANHAAICQQNAQNLIM